MALDRVAFEFDPLDGFDIASDLKEEALSTIADFVKEQVLSYVGSGESPVAGGKWQRELSPEYRKRKAEISGVDFANMELTGAMLDALDVAIEKDHLALEVTGEEAAKADGHNNFSGKSKLPPREFIPNAKKGQNFRSDILAGIRDIAQEFENQTIEERAVQILAG